MKKRYKILIISGVAVIVLLIIAQVYANSVVQKFIRNEIQTLAEEQKDEVYINVDKIRVQLFLKRCILSGVEVHSIDTIPTRLDNSFSIKLNRLILKLDGLTDVFSDGKLKLSSIVLNEPIINYTYKVKIDSLTKSEKSVFKSDKFSQVQLSSFEIKNGQLRLNKFKDSTLSLVTTVFSVDFNMEDVLLNLDEEKIEEKLSFNKIDLNVGNTIFHNTENHDISFGNLQYSSNKEGLTIGELEFRNKAPIENIQGDFDVKEPWINSRIKNLFFNIDFKKLKKKELYFSTIDIDKLDLTLYQNKKDSSDFSIEGLLASIPIPLSIDSLKMKNTNLDFSMVNKKGENDDYVLKKLILSMNYISNDSAYTSLHPEIIGDIKSNLWQKGSVETTFSYNLIKNKTLLKLNVTDFPQRKLKKYFKENELVSFNNGNIISAKLDVLQDSSHIEGNIFLHLNNLDIAFNTFSKSSKLNSISSTLKKLRLHASLFKSGEKQADLYIDTLLIESPTLTIIEKEYTSPAKNSIQSEIDSQQKNPLDAFITIDYASIENASFSYKKKGLKQPLVAANKVSLRERSLVIDLSKEGIQKIVNKGFYSLSISQFELFQEPSNYLSFKNAELNKKENKLDIIGFRYKNKSSKQFFHNSAEEGNNWNSAYVESIAIDIDLERLLKKEIYCPSITVTKPILTHIRALNREEKLKEKAFTFSLPISIDKIEIVDADIDIRIKKEKEKEFEVFDLTELSGSFKDFKINETTTSGSSLFSGKFTSTFYNKGKLAVSFTHDFKKKNSVSSIEGEVKNIPLPMFKEKFTSIASIPIENSSLSSLNFKMTIKNKKISGEVNLDSLSIGKYGLSKDQDSDWLSLNMKRIEVGFSHSDNDKFHFTSIHLIDPNFAMHQVKDAKNDKTKHQSPRSLFASKGKFTAKSKIDKFSIEDGVYRQFKGNTENSPVYSIQNIALTANNIEVYDSTNTKIPVSIRGLDAGLQTIVVHSLPEQDMSIEHFSLSLTENKVQIKNLRLINKQTVETFFKTLKYRKPWIDLYVHEMEIDIELNKLFSTHPRISKVNINNAVFNTLINVGLDQSPKEKPFPNRILANSKFPITVDSILVSNSQLNIQFKENKSKFGLLQFNDVNASVSNLTSDPHQVKKNNEMIWDFHATLWETGKSHVIINYELESENDKFTMYGKCDDLVMTDSDTLTQNLYGISVNDGILYHTYFEIEGNNDEAGGAVSFDYENLRVSLDKKKKKNIKNPDEMQKVKEKDKLSQSFVKSMIVNGLLSKKNLPEKSNYIAQGQAYYKREKDKPIFHLMWFSLSSGILEIAEAGVVKDFRNFNNFFKKKKVEE